MRSKAFLLFFFMIAIALLCCGCGDCTEEETEVNSNIYEDRTDWSEIKTSAYGTGGKRKGSAPLFYLTPVGYYKETSYEKTEDGCQKLAYGVKITGLNDKNLMSVINLTIQNAQAEIRDDFSWVSEKELEKIQSKYDDEIIIIPTNYSDVSVTVYGHILSASLQYIMMYTVNSSDGVHMEEIDADEGRLLYNFDLRDGKVVTLPDLFYDDTDYISLLTPYMNQIGKDMEYPVITAIDGLPELFSTFALTEYGLAIGFPKRNPFTGIECWYVIDLSDIKTEISIESDDALLYFSDDVTFDRKCFEVKDIRFTSADMVSPFEEQLVAVPYVDGIGVKETVNQQLESWYKQLFSTISYTEDELSKGGTLNIEISAPANLINVTAFIYFAKTNRTAIIGRVFSASSGQMLLASSLLNAFGQERAGKIAETVNFRVGSDFTLAIPEQEGNSEYLIFDENEIDRKMFFGN